MGFKLTTKDTQSTTLRNHKGKKAFMNLEKFLNTVLSDTHGWDNHLFKHPQSAEGNLATAWKFQTSKNKIQKNSKRQNSNSKEPHDFTIAAMERSIRLSKVFPAFGSRSIVQSSTSRNYYEPPSKKIFSPLRKKSIRIKINFFVILCDVLFCPLWWKSNPNSKKLWIFVFTVATFLRFWY